jgi:hypothetical protein
VFVLIKLALHYNWWPISRQTKQQKGRESQPRKLGELGVSRGTGVNVKIIRIVCQIEENLSCEHRCVSSVRSLVDSYASYVLLLHELSLEVRENSSMLSLVWNAKVPVERKLEVAPQAHG